MCVYPSQHICFNNKDQKAQVQVFYWKSVPTSMQPIKYLEHVFFYSNFMIAEITNMGKSILSCADSIYIL